MRTSDFVNGGNGQASHVGHVLCYHVDVVLGASILSSSPGEASVLVDFAWNDKTVYRSNMQDRDTKAIPS